MNYGGELAAQSNPDLQTPFVMSQKAVRFDCTLSHTSKMKVEVKDYFISTSLAFIDELEKSHCPFCVCFYL